ncbi:MAG: Fic family protein [Verrucomicrobiales bacterium]|nr:Fic family protein [Verrucomicrobiales bacterium]
MSGIVWLLRDTAIAVHERLLAEFGGLAGMRDKGLLDTALRRPRQRASFGTPTVFDLAAAYAAGVVVNRPFLDGNNRLGFALAATFLELNGQRLQAGEVDATVRTLALAAGALDDTGYAAWLRSNSVPLP